MRLSAKSRYAIMAMLDLATRNRDKPIVLANISKSQGISTSYLEQLFSKLRKAKLIEGVRGPGGGYRLGKPPDEISIAQIVAAVDDSVASKLLKDNTDYKDRDLSVSDKLWEDLSIRFYEFLNGILLADFVKCTEVKRIEVQADATSNQINRMFQPSL